MVDLHPEHARAVLEGLPVGVILTDRDQRVSWANAYAGKMLERAPDTLLGCEVTTLGLPYSPGGVTDEAQMRVDGNVLGITQMYMGPSGEGAILMLLDRGHALVWFLSALASGVPGTVAASGVLARGAITNRIEAEVSRSRRYSNPLSCVTIRLVAEGHRDLLGEIARGVKGQVRWVDLLGQWNSDTLLIILPETDATAAEALQDKIAVTVNEALESIASQASAEIGSSTWRRGENSEQLVGRALDEGRAAVLAGSA